MASDVRSDEEGGTIQGESASPDSPSGPSRGQRRLMYYLFGVAALVFTLGIGAIWALTYGPLG